MSPYALFRISTLGALLLNGASLVTAQDSASEQTTAPVVEPPAAAQPAALRPATGGQNWGANYFPNVELTTHEGKKVKFFDDVIKDKVVVINFIYTSCPDSCPLETARLAEIQAILGDRVGRDTFFYSISIDPDRDTPEVLADYRERYGAGPGWTFLTGDVNDITLLRRKLGLYDPEILQGDNDHEINMVMGNQTTGRWMNASPFVNPYVLADQIGNWLHNWKYHKEDASRDYANAPKLRTITDGEGVFRTRCTACHIIGFGNDAISRQGPNLFGATDRHDREWLHRWIQAPDKMLAAEDPKALELVAAHNGAVMPNLRLTDKEVATVIDYLETETRRLEKLQPALAAAAAQRKAAEDSGQESCCSKSSRMQEQDRLLAMSEGNYEAGPKAAEDEAGKPVQRQISLGAMVSIGAGLLLGMLSIALRRRGH